MKLKQFAIPVIVGLAANQAFSQQEYDNAGSLVVEAPDYDYYEDYVNRESSDHQEAVVTVEGAEFSYTGHNVNITDYFSQDKDGIRVEGAKYLKLSADKDTWNIITVHGGDCGIALGGMLKTSTVSNTQIWMLGTPESPTEQTGIAVGGSSNLVLDNVEIHTDTSMTGDPNIGIYVQGGSTVTNRDMKQVSITSDLSNMGSSLLSIASGGGTIDLVDSTLTAIGSNPYSSVIIVTDTEPGTGTISLTDSRISSATGGNLIGAVAGYDSSEATVNLNNVNLDDAQNQKILAGIDLISGTGAALLHVNLSNKTAFDGSTAVSDLTDSINLDISSGASWNVTQNSALGNLSEDLGSLTLDGSSMISFEQISEGSFTNITSAAIALDAGAILMLGADAATIEGWIEGNGGTYSTQLFVTETEFSNLGVILMSSDGLAFEYTTDNLGTYILTRILPPSIPEPTTATLGLAALGLLALRRRMKN